MGEARPLEPVGPIDTLGLFPGGRAALLELLAGLDASQWSAPTACPDGSYFDASAEVRRSAEEEARCRFISRSSATRPRRGPG